MGQLYINNKGNGWLIIVKKKKKRGLFVAVYEEY